MSIQLDTGQQIIEEMTGLLQECSARGLTEFEERRLTTNFEKIPGDHIRFMCWGMLHALKGNKAESISYHDASLKEGFSYLSLSNYSGSLAYLGLHEDSITIVRKAVELGDEHYLKAKLNLMTRLIGAGYYVESLELLDELHGHPDLTEMKTSSIRDLYEILGPSLEGDFQKLYSSLVAYCLSKHVLIFPIFQIKVITDPESEDYKTVLVLVIARESQQDTSSIISDFIMESEVIEQVSPELLMKLSFSILEVDNSAY